MRFVLGSFFLLLLALPATPQTEQHTPAWPTTPANCKVDGQVVHSLTGVPVPGAVVKLKDLHAWRTKDGHLALYGTFAQAKGETKPETPLTTIADEQGRFQ